MEGHGDGAPAISEGCAFTARVVKRDSGQILATSEAGLEQGWIRQVEMRCAAQPRVIPAPEGRPRS